MTTSPMRNLPRVDESVPSQQGLKHGLVVSFPAGKTRVDESVPSQQGLKHPVGPVGPAGPVEVTSPFHHNKD